MAAPRFTFRGRRVLSLVTLAVALPGLLLAGIGIFLSLRMARAIEEDSLRYNSYVASQVALAFEQELMDQLRHQIGPAEKAARNGAPLEVVMGELRANQESFLAPHFVPLEDLTGYSMLMVEAQPLLYAADERRDDRYFVGVLLSDPRDFIGSGGWWIDPRRFLAEHLANVLQDRLPSNPRLYGGFEATRKLSFELLGPAGEPIERLRTPGNAKTARVEPLSGPFERYAIRVAATGNATVAWVSNFVAFQIALIGLMGLAIVVASVFGFRYTLRQLQLAQMKSSFVSNVTHELKTPIALIRLAVETLEMRRVSSPEETDRFLRTIGRETLRLQQLVDNILDFARLDAGRRIFRFETVDLLEVVRESLETFRPRLEHQGFRVILDLPDALPPVRGDPTALSHVLLNLLDNAVKYSKTQRELTVSADARDAEVMVSVTDRGIGIAPADQPRVFETFVRLETGLVHDVKGAGLGLSLVDQIIRAHGGRVELRSAVGEGSTFTIVLPVAGGMEAARPEPSRKTGS
jgi:signal transduction histidine kinase